MAAKMNNDAAASGNGLAAAHDEFERLNTPRTQRKLYNFAYKILENASDAEDVVQDALVRAWNNFDSFNRDRSFEGWVVRIVGNRCIDLLRRKGLIIMVSYDDYISDPNDNNNRFLSYEPADKASDPAKLFERNELVRDVRQAVGRLPQDLSLPISKVDLRGDSYQEVANVVGCPIGTIRTRLHRGRNLLSSYLEEYKSEGEKPAQASNPKKSKKGEHCVP